MCEKLFLHRAEEAAFGCCCLLWDAWSGLPGSNWSQTPAFNSWVNSACKVSSENHNLPVVFPPMWVPDSRAAVMVVAVAAAAPAAGPFRKQGGDCCCCCCCLFPSHRSFSILLPVSQLHWGRGTRCLAACHWSCVTDLLRRLWGQSSLPAHHEGWGWIFLSS